MQFVPRRSAACALVFVLGLHPEANPWTLLLFKQLRKDLEPGDKRPPTAHLPLRLGLGTEGSDRHQNQAGFAQWRRVLASAPLLCAAVFEASAITVTTGAVAKVQKWPGERVTTSGLGRMVLMTPVAGHNTRRWGRIRRVGRFLGVMTAFVTPNCSHRSNEGPLRCHQQCQHLPTAAVIAPT